MIAQALFSSISSCIVWLFCVAELVTSPRVSLVGDQSSWENQGKNSVHIWREFNGPCGSLSLYLSDVKSLAVCAK